MKQREIQDPENITWTCVQAYSSMTNGGDNEEAAKVDGAEDKVKVVCTPTGGAQTVRLELPKDWVENLSDEELTEEIQKEQG